MLVAAGDDHIIAVLRKAMSDGKTGVAGGSGNHGDFVHLDAHSFCY